MNYKLFMLLFESIFIVIGGIALGQALRRLLAHQFSTNSIFLVIWGSIFALVPLVAGSSSLAELHAEYLVLVQVLLLLAATAITAFTPQEYLSAFTSRPISLVAFGAFILVLDAVVMFGLNQQDLFTNLVGGSVFAIVGAALITAGVRMAARNR